MDEARAIVEAHDITEQVRHALLHGVPHLASAIIHADPCGHGAETLTSTWATRNRPSDLLRTRLVQSLSAPA